MPQLRPSLTTVPLHPPLCPPVPSGARTKADASCRRRPRRSVSQPRWVVPQHADPASRPRGPRSLDVGLQCLVTHAGHRSCARLGWAVWVLECSIFTRPAVVWALCASKTLSGVLDASRGAVCRLDGMSPLAYVRKIASTPSTLSRYGGRGAIWESLSGWDFGDVVRVETWGRSRCITSRETLYITPRPIHWACSTSCPLDRHHSPPGHPARVKTSPAAAPFSWHLGKPLADRDMGQHQFPPWSFRQHHRAGAILIMIAVEMR